MLKHYYPLVTVSNFKQTNEPQLIEVVETNVIIQDVNPVDSDVR